MKTVTISNVLCHESLELDIPTGATLITGENSSGKTSIARVLAALTTHSTNPAKLSAALAKAYLKKGAVEGYAKLSDGPTWILPNKMEVLQGMEPETGLHMTGVIDFIGSTASSAADRAAIYEALFLPEDPEDILRPHWKGSEHQLEAVLKIVRSDKGWKGAAAIYDEQKKDAGRRWGQIAGTRYTKKRGTQWRPDEWSAELEGLSEDDVLTALTEAQDALRAAGVQQAVEQERIDRGVEARDEKVPAQEEKVATAKTRAEVARDEQDKANEVGTAKRSAIQKLRADIEAIVAENAAKEALLSDEEPAAPHSCPWCDEPLRIDVDGAPARWEQPKPPNTVIVQAEIEANNKKLGRLRAELEEAEAEFKTLSADYGEKRRAAEAATNEYNQELGVLREYRQQAKDADLSVTESNDAVRSALENERDRADARRKAWVQNRDAAAAHENYVEYETIAVLLGPTGARAQHMKSHMDRVRKALEAISGKTGWKPITITDAYEVVTGGYPAVLAAENEKRKCQWAIQAALLMLDRGAHWLILDAADLLRGESWEGLEGLVNALINKRDDLHVVVCATETECPLGWNEINLSEAA